VPSYLREYLLQIFVTQNKPDANNFKQFNDYTEEMATKQKADDLSGIKPQAYVTIRPYAETTVKLQPPPVGRITSTSDMSTSMESRLLKLQKT